MMPGRMANDWYNRSADSGDDGTQALAAERRPEAESRGTVVETSAPPRVFVVNHNEAAREGLRQLCASVGLAVETYPTAEAFLEALDGRRPGCLLLEVCLPGMGGFGLQRELSARKIGLPIVFVTGYGDVQTAVDALRAGAFDYFEEPFSRQLLLDRVHQALEMDRAISRMETQRADFAGRLAGLTPREREVMDLVVDGKTNKEIAGALVVREKTVECHRANLMRKLSVESLAALIRLVLTVDPERSPRSSNCRAPWILFWLLASLPSLMSGLMDDVLPDLPELAMGLASSLGFA